VWHLPKAARGFEDEMIYLTAVITALLFVYLGVALVRPEWF
jgi:K+-transporting ATPase KdpF subunit